MSFSWTIKLFFALLILNGTCRAAGETAGPTNGGGGGDTAADFAQVARETLSSMRDKFGYRQTINGQAIDFGALLAKLRAAEISSTNEQLVLRGRNVDAINYPNEVQIIFNKPAWDGMNRFRQARLSVHEVMGLAGVPDPGFENSDAIARRYTQEPMDFLDAGAIGFEALLTRDLEIPANGLLYGLIFQEDRLCYISGAAGLQLHRGERFVALDHYENSTPEERPDGICSRPASGRPSETCGARASSFVVESWMAHGPQRVPGHARVEFYMQSAAGTKIHLDCMRGNNTQWLKSDEVQMMAPGIEFSYDRFRE